MTVQVVLLTAKPAMLAMIGIPKMTTSKKPTLVKTKRLAFWYELRKTISPTVEELISEHG